MAEFRPHLLKKFATLALYEQVAVANAPAVKTWKSNKRYNS